MSFGSGSQSLLQNVGGAMGDMTTERDPTYTSGNWFRSEPMNYVQLVLNKEVARNVVGLLGNRGTVQFVDLNPEAVMSDRPNASELKRIENMERQLRFFKAEMKKLGVKAHESDDSSGWLEGQLGRSSLRELKEMRPLLSSLENDLRTLNRYNEGITREYNKTMELFQVYRQGHMLVQKARGEEPVDLFDGTRGGGGGGSARRYDSFDGAGDLPLLNRGSKQGGGDEDLEGALGGAGDVSELRFNFIAGVIDQAQLDVFRRMVFRSTRGNCFTGFSPVAEPMADPSTGEFTSVAVFVIYYQADVIGRRIRRLCGAYDARVYDSVTDLSNSRAVEKTLLSVNQRLVERLALVRQNAEKRRELLVASVAPNLQEWLWKLRREKAVCHAMNQFQDRGGMVVAEGWVLEDDYDRMANAVALACGGRGYVTRMKEFPEKRTPPTFFYTNKFTYAFQAFVATYGVARYQEANPALFTAVTFPFEFGVMFGDLGHGTVLAMFGFWLCYYETYLKKALKESMGDLGDMVWGGRYMLFLMGLFAMYGGLIYNDIFSLTLNAFGSVYVFPDENATEAVKTDPNAVYAFGLDPQWHNAANELTFSNSYKMKLSVIIGITQMIFGTFLKMSNCFHFQDWATLLEVIPMLVFSFSLFAYMLFLIFLKWSIDWPAEAAKANGKLPPSIITQMIGMALKPIAGGPKGPDVDRLWLYEGQDAVQDKLLLVAFLAIPCILVLKPIAVIYFGWGPEGKALHKHMNAHGGGGGGHGHGHGEEEERGLLGGGGIGMADVVGGGARLGDNRSAGAGLSVLDNDADEFGAAAGEGGGDAADGGEVDLEAHSTQDIWVHQVIETIEFVLGMVSNTASYLRLWALSLAHAQLAKVFWEKAMVPGLTAGSPVSFIFVVVGYAAWSCITLGVLLLMDPLECFLHTLRLHWVEFQNKFYKADGIPFEPLNFSEQLEHVSLEAEE